MRLIVPRINSPTVSSFCGHIRHNGIINDNCSAPSRRRKSVEKFYIEKKKKDVFHENSSR